MLTMKKQRQAVAYLRTSSAANVNGDSEQRQWAAISAYAESNTIEVVGRFYDAAVSGADPVTGRPGFADMMERIAGNGVRMVLVESPDRFARDLIVAETGHSYLKEQGIELVPTTAPDYFIAANPTNDLIRHILGAVAQFDKATTVAKLKAARDRKRAATGKCEGRKPYAETVPEAVEMAKRLRRQSKRKYSYRMISKRLALAGHVTGNGTPYCPSAISDMIKQQPRRPTGADIAA